MGVLCNMLQKCSNILLGKFWENDLTTHVHQSSQIQANTETNDDKYTVHFSPSVLSQLRYCTKSLHRGLIEQGNSESVAKVNKGYFIKFIRVIYDMTNMSISGSCWVQQTTVSGHFKFCT